MSRTSTELTTLSAPAMGSRWTARLAAPPEGLAAALAAAVERIEAAASLWRPDSALCRLNAAPAGVWVGLPLALLDLLALALRLGGRTGGLFDIAMGGLTAAWGFGAAQGRMDPAAMSAPPRAPGATAAALELDMPNRRARKHAPLTLTLDGIAKGHAGRDGRACPRAGRDARAVRAGRRAARPRPPPGRPALGHRCRSPRP